MTMSAQPRKRRDRRRWIRAGSAAVVVGALGFVVADRADHDGGSSSGERGGLTAAEFDTAVRVARLEIAQQDAHITRATAIVRSGSVTDHNLSGTCTSGRLLEVELVGGFPHTGVSPDQGAPTGPNTWVTYTSDATSPEPCDVTMAIGRFRPPEGGADLMPALSGS